MARFADTTAQRDMRRLGIWSLALWGCVSLVGCSTNDYPTSGPGATRTIKAQPSFAVDIQEVFDRRGCSGASCHGMAQVENLDLRSGRAYDDLVNVLSTRTTQPLVSPGDVANSYLISKLEGPGVTGGRMPLGAAPLDATDLQNIKNWIALGALNN